MNVTVIYGISGKTCTYDFVQLLLADLKLNLKIRVNEFFLPKDYFSSDYHTNPRNYLNIYSNVTIFNSIIKSLSNSDLIILASSVFKCDMSVEMKILLDNLSHHCMNNNITALMNNKIGLVISTTAGAGLFRTTRTLKKNLNFLGINNTFEFSKNLYETNWENINLKTKKQIINKIFKLSYKIAKLYCNPQTSKSQLFRKISFFKPNPIIKNNTYNVIDLNCWKKQTCYHSRNF